ncbi:MAG: hypothetical protein JXA73_24745 [Acidobacteria bacterium]|nr:hypothetical protein [Acidobacteriota bacterium]
MSPCKNIMMIPFRNPAWSAALVLVLLMQPVSMAAPDTVLPETTRITLQLNNHLSTKVNSEGDSFTAYVTTPVSLGDKIVIPKGSVVTGSISRIIRPGRFKGKAIMNVLFQSIEIPGRGQLPLVASLAKMGSEASGEIRTEGTVEGEGSEGSDIGKIVMPGLVGTGIGSLAGGGKGAAIGAGIGAAFGLATIFAARGKEIEVPRGSALDIILVKPLTIPTDEENSTYGNR